MIVSVPKELPAAAVLRRENLTVLDPGNPVLDMLNPLRIAIVNLMPDKPQTELQLARLLGHAPFPVDITFARPEAHVSKSTPAGHLERFYRTIPELAEAAFDGLICTGAPVEMLAFEDVTYWPEMQAVFDWADRSVSRSLFICWSAQAALYHRHGVPKTPLDRKAFGVSEQAVLSGANPAVAGLGAAFPTPVSRHTEVRARDVAGLGEIDIVAASADTGLCLLDEPARGAWMMFNHLEYDAMTLDAEYRRDIACGRKIAIPENYYPGNDPGHRPVHRWSAAAQRFFTNWILDIAGLKRYPGRRELDGTERFAAAG